MASTVEFVDSNSLDTNHYLHCLAHSSYSRLEELAEGCLSKLHLSAPRSRSSLGRPQYSATTPWLELPLGNRNLTEAAVVVIGGGISGICTAIRLLTQQRLKNFVIIEKSGGFGGTWRDNKFPGCCCDVWSQLYCFSFEQNPDWTRAYPGQEEILNYLTDVAHKYELYKYARFNSTVEEARWDDETMKWEVKVSIGGGKDAEFGGSYTIRSDYLVSGTGQLNKPKPLDVPGINEYQGKLFHSARWDWSYQIEGKRIAVVGTGPSTNPDRATTAQIVPEIAKIAKHLTVVQRSPAWVIPRHDQEIPAWKRALLKWAPPIRWRYRAEAMDIRESFFLAVTKPNSHYAQHMRELNHKLMREHLPNQPDMWQKLTPKYSPGCKRSVISDDYYPTLGRANVHLETNKIERITLKGIKFEGKPEEEFDLIITCTGFESLSFLSPIKIFGRHGRSLDEIWSRAPHAYKGVTVPDLPNFGILYGPNSNLSHNSLILMIEAQVNYMSVMIEQVLKARYTGQTLALTPKKHLTEAYNKNIQEALAKTSFADPACSSWWKREDGVIPNNWSGTAVDYQKAMSSLDWNDFDAEGTAADSLRSKPVAKIGRVVEETQISRTLAATLVIGIAGLSVGGYLTRS